PDVRIALAGLVADASAQADPGEGVDPLTAGSRDGLLDRRLETVREVEDDVGSKDAGDVAGSELDVVRLGSRRGEIFDIDLRPAQLLGDEGARTERCGPGLSSVR